jgi:hypothetical protein
MLREVSRGEVAHLEESGRAAFNALANDAVTGIAGHVAEAADSLRE